MYATTILNDQDYIEWLTEQAYDVSLQNQLMILIDARCSYHKRMAAAYAMIGTLQNDPETVSDMELNWLIEWVVTLIGCYNYMSINLRDQLLTMIYLAQDIVEDRVNRLDEYNDWLDDVATWRYDFYEDEWKSSTGHGEMFEDIEF